MPGWRPNKSFMPYGQEENQVKLLILNQMAGPMTWEFAEDAGTVLGSVALLTGHPDTLAKNSTTSLHIHPAPAYCRGSFPRRVFSWLAYCLKAFFWLLQWPKEIPLLIFSNPPILCWLAYLMQILRGQHYAVMVHDIYPDVLIRLQRFSESDLLIRAWRALNRHAYQNARVVMTMGEFMAANLEKQFDSTKTSAGKVEIIYPWVDTDKIRPMPKEENWFAQKYNQVGKLTVMYSGNMGLGHDIETMLEVAKQLKNYIDISFMFIGTGPKWIIVEKAIHDENLSNVILLPWQPESNLPYTLSTADISLVSIESEFEGLMIPSKGIYSLAAGSMLVEISSKNNEIAHCIIENQVGIFVAPGDYQTIVKYICNLSNDPNRLKYFKNNSRNISERQFSRQVCFKQLQSILRINLF